ncbi:MAG: hypothetical protein ACLURP_00540 [Ruminococcus sp.]
MNKRKKCKKSLLWNMIGSTYCQSPPFCISWWQLIVGVWRTAGRVLFLKLRYCTAASAGGTLWCPHLSRPRIWSTHIFSEYEVSRIITCALMMLFGIIYSSFSFKGEYIIISTFIIMMKMIDAVEDVFHGNLQQKYHVEQMGKMLAARNLYSAVFFTAMHLLSLRTCTRTCGVATSTTSPHSASYH